MCYKYTLNLKNKMWFSSLKKEIYKLFFFNSLAFGMIYFNDKSMNITIVPNNKVYVKQKYIFPPKRRVLETNNPEDVVWNVISNRNLNHLKFYLLIDTIYSKK